MLAGGDSAIKFIALHHHASCFFKQFKMETWDLPVLHSKNLEHIKQQTAKDKLGDALCSLNDTSKLRILSAAEDLVIYYLVIIANYKKHCAYVST